MTPLPDTQRSTLERLLNLAKGDTGQSKRVADFLLAWWNAEENGGFDLVSFWNVDPEIVTDMLTIVHLIAEQRCYPDTWGYGQEFESLVRQWRRNS